MKAVEGGGLGEPAGKIRNRFWWDTEVIGPPECPVFYRWTLARVLGRKVFFHRFQPNADDRAEHDHPAPFWTFVLRGSYVDRSYCVPCDGDGFLLPDDAKCRACGGTGEVRELMRPGMLRYRAAEYRHVTRVGPRGCWTLVLMGRKTRRWGFWEKGVWWFWKDHEREFGYGMRCPDLEDES